MSQFYVTQAGPDDDMEINRLLRQRPMGKLMRISLEREPSPGIAAKAEGFRHNTILVRDATNDRLVGMGSRAVKKVFYNNDVCQLGYLGLLRAAKGSHGLKRLAAGYEGVRRCRKEADLPFDITSIVADNLPAKRLLERGLKGLPTYRALTEFTTFILSASGNENASLVTMASRQDLPEIVSLLNEYNQQYQFANFYTEKDLLESPNLKIENFMLIRESGKIVACLALWDQRPFKQTVVQSYEGWLKVARPIVNLWQRCLRKPVYIRAPFVVPMAFLSHFAMPELKLEYFVALIEKAKQMGRSLNIDYLAIGFSEHHPCHRFITERFKYHSYASTLFSVQWAGQPPVAETELNRLIAHPELALL